MLAHPSGHSDAKTALAVLGGAALYPAGNAAFRRTITRRLAGSHASGIAALALLAFATPHLSPLALSAGCALVLVAVAARDAFANRRAVRAA